MSVPNWIPQLIENARKGKDACSRCPAHEDGRSERVNPGLFNPDADLMFVTIEPSHSFNWDNYNSNWEDYNATFTEKFLNDWRGGPVLQELLKPLNMSMEDVWMGDAIKCPPPSGDDNAKREEEFNHCMGYLVDEMRAVNPDVVVTLGEKASMRTLIALGQEPRSIKISRECGRIIDTDPPTVTSTHWGNGWLYRKPTKTWGDGWLDDQPHLQGESFERYMEIVRRSVEVVLA